jgi:hypothetical protein
MAILHLHLYAPTSLHFSPDMLFNYLRGTVVEDPSSPFYNPVDRFAAAGVILDYYKNVAHATADFKKSLLDDGSVVAYLGHGVPDNRCMCSRGLSWLGQGSADITPGELMGLLTASRAKLVILSTCASSTFGLEKLKAGPAVVVTNSGSDLVTKSGIWGQALAAFLLLLIGYRVNYQTSQPYLPPSPPTTSMTAAVGAGLPAAVGAGLPAAVAGLPAAVANKLVTPRTPRGSIGQAVDAANEAFKANKTTDRCVLAHGEGSMVVFP